LTISQPSSARLVVEPAHASRPTLGQRLWPESGAANPIPAVDGLRALAVLLVMFFHAWHNQPGMYSSLADQDQHPIWYARTGLNLFFVLSGFLLFLPYAKWMQGGRRPSARLFYRRRILRIGPAYWACLVILVLTAPITIPSLADGLIHSVFIFNLVPASVFSINGVFWTMAVEVQFYALLPLLGLGAYSLSRRWGMVGTATIMVAITMLVSAASGLLERRFDPNHDQLILTGLVGQRSMSFYLCVFGAGMATSVLYTWLGGQKHGSLALSPRWGRLAALAAIAAMIVALVLALWPSVLNLTAGRNAIYGYLYAILVFGVLLGSPALRRVFEFPAIRFVGLISYSLYLWHTIVLGVFVPSLGQYSPPLRVLIGFALLAVSSIPVAYLSYMLAERPFLYLRRQARDEQPAEIPLAVRASVEAAP